MVDFKVSKSYCTVSDVEAATGVAADVTGGATTAQIQAYIKDASDEVDLLTHTRYHSVEDSGTATAGSTTSLTDGGQSWTGGQWENYVLWIYAGTGSGQYAPISSNTATVLLLGKTLTTAPDATSQYRIIPDVYFDDNIDGSGKTTLNLNYYPLIELISLSIRGTAVTPAKVYQFKKIGELILNSNLDPEFTYFDSTYPQQVDIEYVYGVYPVPRVIKRLTAIIAGMKSLILQIGGTYNDVTSYSVPHFTASKGEPYTNIRETLSRLEKEKDKLLEKSIIIYPIVV